MPRGDPSRKRCAIYTRKSSEERLEQEFISLILNAEHRCIRNQDLRLLVEPASTRSLGQL
jgi:hypothetical protein